MAGEAEGLKRQPLSDRLLDGVVDFLATIAAFLLCGLTVLVCADVAARYLRLFSLPWIFDFTEYALYVITFVGAPRILRDGGHISVDIMIHALGERSRTAVGIAAKIIGAATCLVLLYLFCTIWWRSFWEGTRVHDTLVFPEWLLFSVPPPVFLIMLMLFIRDLRGARAGAHRRGKDGF